MKRPRIVSIGEIIWDMLPKGKQLGGAPANFICHAKSLGAEATLISRVGNDALGEESLRLFRERGFDLATIQRDETAPTSTATVKLSADGQATFTIHENVAWDFLEMTDAAVEAVSQADVICFGSLAQRATASRKAIQGLLAKSRPDALRITDINLRAPFYDAAVIEASLRAANALKLNDQELPILARQFGLDGDTRGQLQQLADRFGLGIVAYTRGSNGSLLLAHGTWSEQPGIAVNVRDTVGAGDSFTAALVMGVLHGLPLDEINRRANDVAAFVCTQDGATPKLPDSLLF
jgi:fructokinase